MKLAQFSYVAAIAERGSLRAAARHLGVAQPAFSRSIAELERELGAPLFERRATGMVPTKLGQAFVRRANAILNDVRRARDEFEQLRGNAVGTVTIGLSIAAHLRLLPGSLRSFREAGPGPEAAVDPAEGDPASRRARGAVSRQASARPRNVAQGAASR
jgi:DNA-binding transcriptional LysR family regulator